MLSVSVLSVFSRYVVRVFQITLLERLMIANPIKRIYITRDINLIAVINNSQRYTNCKQLIHTFEEACLILCTSLQFYLLSFIEASIDLQNSANTQM